MNEADRIYRALFGRPAPPEVVARFLAAPEWVFPPLDEEQRRGYQQQIAHVRDLEALELASRLRGCNLLLRLKFQLMVHLAECHPAARGALVNRRNRSVLVVLPLLGWHLARTGYKLLRGWWLLRKYHGP